MITGIGTGRGLGFDALWLCLPQQVVLLAGLSTVVPQGATLAVMGRSGAGKSTLLRAIAGLVQPSSGRVERPAGRVPVVFQEPRLLPWRSALQNVELVVSVEQRDRARQWLARVGLADSADAYPQTLSGGMRQRVSIARALACESPVLLVDEPFAHLDVLTAAQLRTEFTDHLAGLTRTTVWVTHEPGEAAAVAQRTLVMAGPPHGAWQIVQHDPSHTVEQTAARLAAALQQTGTANPDRMFHGPTAPISAATG